MKNKKFKIKQVKYGIIITSHLIKKNLWTGNQYPNEALVRFVSNLRKNKNKIDYFKDHGKGFSIKNNFSVKSFRDWFWRFGKFTHA